MKAEEFCLALRGFAIRHKGQVPTAYLAHLAENVEPFIAVLG